MSTAAGGLLSEMRLLNAHKYERAIESAAKQLSWNEKSKIFYNPVTITINVV